MGGLSIASGAAAVLAVVVLVFAIAKWRAAAAREAQWRAIAAQGTAEAVRLKRLVDAKESEIVALQGTLSRRMSPDDLADALNSLFGGKPPNAGN